MPNLADRVPESGFTSDDDALEVFIDWVIDSGITPYPAQEEAFLELFGDRHVLLKTPTGSGKSLVGVCLHFRAFARSERSVYTAPIKALVSEKFFALCEVFGAENVGLATGDGSVNPDASILCCTAEVLAQLSLRQGADTPFAAVVMDEFHYYADRDRGMAWQVPLLTMPNAQFLLMSATLGSTVEIERDLEERTGREVAAVTNATRPVPLHYEYSEVSLLSKLHHLVTRGDSPVYVVCFTQREAVDLAASLLSTEQVSKDHKKRIGKELKGFRFDSPFGATLRRMLLHGVGVHHAGLLPKYRLLVEKLSQQGLFAVICGTDTLGVGINVPIRSVLFTQLCKYDGEKVDILTVRDFRQISGRAGRKGFDDEGRVVVQAPAWIIDNAKVEAAVASGKKKKKKAKAKPPTRGYKHWDRITFEKMTTAPCETLESRFKVDHALVLSLLQRGTELDVDGMAEVHALIDAAHLTRREREELHTEADQRLEQLIGAGVVEREKTAEGPRYTVYDDLQDDFSLHHALSLFLLHAVRQLDPTEPNHHLDVLTVVESILEHPGVVLRAQRHRERGRVVAELKAEGVEYEERMEALEEVTWPRPKAEWIQDTFERYREKHPWLSDTPIRVKGVVREMVEEGAVFSAYVKGLGLERAEGVLLRYLSQVYKTLLQNVPLDVQTDDVWEVIGYLRAMLARVDDSLLTEWEALVDGSPDEALPDRPVDISADAKVFRARVRAELHAVVRALARADFDEAAASIRQVEGSEFTANDFETALEPFLAEHGRVVFDGRAKQAWNTVMEPAGAHRWTVRQVLVGPWRDELEGEEEEEPAAWSIDGLVDLSDDTNPSGPVVQVLRIGE
ncbi:MAG: superfamily II RNA helicase [Myxococcota bacterium]|jgi:superfamily II RNA helicase